MKACPKCKSPYNVSADQAGERFSCQSCGARLLIEANRIVLAPDDPASDPPAASSADHQNDKPSFFERWQLGGKFRILGLIVFPPWLRNSRLVAAITESLRQDFATWLFGAGVILVILGIFLPLIDQAKVQRRDAQIRSGDRRQKYLDDQLQLKIDLARKQGSNLAFSKERKERDDAKDEWQQEKLRLSAERDEAEMSFRIWNYWYLWGMMVGFFLLSIASLCYLQPNQSTPRRIVGSVVLCAQLVLIFYAFVMVSIATTAPKENSPPPSDSLPLNN
ncbi:MAG: hypothetical protein KatS3mg105_2776 [Gemmatales bacterium]|nr:MAG: hypothetical protein KatS3mg105_2776 [Gemmatales bacterium]